MIVPFVDPIKYLVYRRFPDACLLAKIVNVMPIQKSSGSQVSYNPTFESHKWPNLSPEAEDYRKELMAFDKQKIERLYKEELKNEYNENDQKRFFNETDADADFDFWSKASHWTLDECIALTFGKDPRVVTWIELKKILSYTSPFVEKFIEIRDLTTRAKQWQKLFDPVLPGIYIGWARQNDIPFPQELVDMVVARGNHIPDWKKSYDTLLLAKNEYSEQVKLLLEKRDTVEKFLKDRISQLELEPPKTPKQGHVITEKSLTVRERETVLKLIIGMAISGYSYKPKDSKSPVSKEIEGDLDILGISVSDDTIRKWLKEASKILPPDTE